MKFEVGQEVIINTSTEALSEFNDLTVRIVSINDFGDDCIEVFSALHPGVGGVLFKPESLEPVNTQPEFKTGDTDESEEEFRTRVRRKLQMPSKKSISWGTNPNVSPSDYISVERGGQTLKGTCEPELTIDYKEDVPYLAAFDFDRPMSPLVGVIKNVEKL